MILEGLVTTLNPDGSLHMAPMGPMIGSNFSTLLLRPFPSSTTYRNLTRLKQGIFHITDDAALIARAALSALETMPATHPAQHVQGQILSNACRYYEFSVRSIDTAQERVHIHAEVVGSGTLREFLGFNRARNAIVEGAILASRFHILPAEEIDRDFARYRIIVDKTGDDREREAMAFLEERWASYKSRDGLPR